MFSRRLIGCNNLKVRFIFILFVSLHSWVDKTVQTIWAFWWNKRQNHVFSVLSEPRQSVVSAGDITELVSCCWTRIVWRLSGSCWTFCPDWWEQECGREVGRSGQEGAGGRGEQSLEPQVQRDIKALRVFPKLLTERCYKQEKKTCCHHSLLHLLSSSAWRVKYCMNPREDSGSATVTVFHSVAWRVRLTKLLQRKVEKLLGFTVLSGSFQLWQKKTGRDGSRDAEIRRKWAAALLMLTGFRWIQTTTKKKVNKNRENTISNVCHDTLRWQR